MKFSVIVVALAVLSVLILLASKWRRSSETSSPDGEVIAQLREAGSDLSKPHPVEFFLYFPTEEAAGRAQSRLADRGFTVEVEQAEQGPDWVALARRLMVPTEAELVQIREELNALAEREGGQYDGWGTPVVQ